MPTVRLYQCYGDALVRTLYGVDDTNGLFRTVV
jgi:hypothetical protein